MDQTGAREERDSEEPRTPSVDSSGVTRKPLPPVIYEGISVSADEVNRIMAEYLSTPAGRAEVLQSCAERIEGWLTQGDPNADPKTKETVLRLVQIMDYVLEIIGDDEVLPLRLLAPFFRAKALWKFDM